MEAAIVSCGFSDSASLGLAVLRLPVAMDACLLLLPAALPRLCVLAADAVAAGCHCCC